MGVWLAFVVPSTSFYWSSTPVTGSNEVWAYELVYGTVARSGKTAKGLVYLVRDTD